MRDSFVDVLASDHAPHTMTDKVKGAPGMPHLDTLGPFAGWLIKKCGFSPGRVAEVLSQVPGKILAPDLEQPHGAIEPGWEASFTVLDFGADCPLWKTQGFWVAGLCEHGADGLLLRHAIAHGSQGHDNSGGKVKRRDCGEHLFVKSFPRKVFRGQGRCEMDFVGKDLISMNDLTREEIDEILQKVPVVRNNPDKKDLCQNKVSAMLFFEPSTRTRCYSKVAMRNLGGKVGGFYDANITSSVKEESLWDTVKMHDGYGFDVMVIRHPLKGAARLAAEAAEIPVINAGDGPNQHPTQTLLDLYSIQETQGKIDGLTIAMVGDLANGRTVHSLTEALLKYNDCRLIFISPRDLRHAPIPDRQVQKIMAGTGRNFH